MHPLFRFTKFEKPLPACKYILIRARIWIESDEACRIAVIKPSPHITSEMSLYFRFQIHVSYFNGNICLFIEVLTIAMR